MTLFIGSAVCRLATTICFATGASFPCRAVGTFAGRLLSVAGKATAPGGTVMAGVVGGGSNVIVGSCWVRSPLEGGGVKTRGAGWSFGGASVIFARGSAAARGLGIGILCTFLTATCGLPAWGDEARGAATAGVEDNASTDSLEIPPERSTISNWNWTRSAEDR